MSVPVKPFKSRFTKFDYFIIGLTYVFFPLALIIAGFRILPTQQHHSFRGTSSDQSPISAASLGPKSHECAGCGNRIMLNPNESVPCDYCGLTLSYTSSV